MSVDEASNLQYIGEREVPILVVSVLSSFGQLFWTNFSHRKKYEKRGIDKSFR
jgi:hypothetical protein